jgi:hypothetical protein
MNADETRYIIFPDKPPGWSAILFVVGLVAVFALQPPAGTLSIPAAVAGFVFLFGLVVASTLTGGRSQDGVFTGRNGAIILVFFWTLTFVAGVAFGFKGAFDGFLFGGILAVGSYNGLYLLIAREVSGW